MKKLTLKTIDKGTRELYDRAHDALQRKNYDYAIDLFQSCLKKAPAFQEARRELRQAALLKCGGKLGAIKAAGVAMKNSMNLSVKIPGLIRKGHYTVAMEHIEEVLAQDPTNVSSLKLLAEAAEEAGMGWTAVDAMELACRTNPDDVDLNLYLCELYLSRRRGSDAVELASKLMRKFPDNGAVRKMVNGAQAGMAMDNSNWEEEEELDTDDPVAEDSNTEAAAEDEAGGEEEDATDKPKASAKFLKMLEEGRDSVDLRKRLARELIKEESFDQAIEILQVALENSGGEVDLQLQKLIYEAAEGRITSAIVAWQDYLDTSDDADARAEAQAQIDALEIKKSDFQLERAREQAETYVNDSRANMAYAEILVDREMFEEALDPLTKAAGATRYQVRAHMMRGFCRIGLKIYDKAEVDLDRALSESKGSEDCLAELYYHTATVAEKLENKEKAAEFYVKASEAGAKFADLEEKVNEFKV